MNIKIYQINMERDHNRMAFMSLDSLERFRGSSVIRSEIYDKVFEGEVRCEDIEDVYRMFNIDQPDGYIGRSMSVSDVIGVKEHNGVYKFYYCDAIGFKKIDFMPEESKKMVKYINALAFKKKYLEQPQGDPGVIFTVDDMPAADVAEIVHGRWISDPDCGVTKCSVCYWSIEGRWQSDYCPDCGAKMDSDEENYEEEYDFFDKETIVENCTVQILENTETGAVSVGWWRNEN